MKHNHDRVMQAKKIVALISTCSVTIERAVNVALSSVGGTVFDAKLKEVDERVVWRVKLLNAGRQVKVYIDGRSGLVLEAKAETFVADKREDGVMSDRMHSFQSASQ
jgi:uncharacterized membrane protein YkoI